MNRTSLRVFLSVHLEVPVARILHRLGFTPNAITLVGLLGAASSGVIISYGNLWLGGVVMLVAGVFDLFDGALARATGKVSKFGALLDSVVDRVSEMLVLLGLLIFYLKGDSFEGAIIVYLTVTGSVMVSYLRARSEGLGLENFGGIMTRPERVTILGLGLIIGHWFGFLLLIVLVIVAGLAIFTTGQRLFHIWKTPHSGDS